MDNKKRNNKANQKASGKQQKGVVKNRIEEGLKSSKFRFLNEQLYTSHSNNAVDLFKENPALFDDYHTGYRQQVDKWPKNPLDILIDELKKPKYTDCDIGDFGCGEGRLQLDLEANGHRGTIYSFDVGKAAEHIIQTDIASVPLEEHELDVALFSLSLMGINFPEFLKEANRALKPGGTLFIAEVLSRFKDVKEFLKMMREQTGFKHLKVNKLKDFFYIMVFEKVMEADGLQLTDDFADQLKPCLYKKR